MQTKLMQKLVSLEYLAAALVVAIFFVVGAHFDWWWLLLLFPIFDVSAVGYLANDKLGALFYNIGHSIIGPVALVGFYIMTGDQALIFVALLWLFHIFTDRALGYGLKHSKGFHHTHLGPIGKARKR